MKVSVIITTYNRPDYLRRVLDAHLAQGRQPEEILVADDGSGPETALMLQELQVTSPIPIIHVWQENQGFRAGTIRNRAAAQATGSYLILTDDDIIPAANFIRDHVDYAETGHFIQGHRVLMGPHLSRRGTYRDLSFGNLVKWGLRRQAANVTNGLTLPWPLIVKSRQLKGIRSCNMSFFRRDFLAVNGFNQDFQGWGKEDSELAVRFFKYGLTRKDIRYRAGCFHLYHPEYSRDNLEQNLRLLAAAQAREGYYCANGIDQFLP
jgi:glycosyltransferase involved in cell wall biosynthesis